jgi:hypothetical protein
MLQRVWAEMNYWLDACHVTRAETLSTYEVLKKLGEFSFLSVARML